MRGTLTCVCLALLLSGCALPGEPDAFAAAEDVPALREIQTRRYESSEPVLLLKTAMAAMQDLQFVIDDAEPPLGLATGTALIRGARVRLTVFVRPVDGDDCVVRASVHRGALLTHEPEVYRDFFDALDVAMALP